MTQTDDETFTLDQIRRYLREFYGIERITLEIAQPNRLPEVVTEMEREGIIEQVDDETWTLSD